jgi:GrpB-like predicted nucleotidyltransferase (UPF0157 family)
MTIKIEPADPAWPEAFAVIKQTILPVAPAGAIIHHIGSTAVAGLPAKDVIDIQLTVSDLSAVDGAAIEARGFRERFGRVDHCPPGLIVPEVELQKRFFIGTGRRVHLHIRQGGRFNQRFALLSRDFLRTHPTSAGAYALIKQRLASRFPEDEDAYYDIKDPVFDIIMDGAEDWARLIGWSPPPGD